MTNNLTSNILVIFGALVGLVFILVGGVIALVYSDGVSASIVLPILLAQIGPLIALIITLAKAIENGAKTDSNTAQISQIANFVNTPQAPAPPSAVVVNVPPPATKEENHGTS